MVVLVVVVVVVVLVEARVFKYSGNNMLVKINNINTHNSTRKNNAVPS